MPSRVPVPDYTDARALDFGIDAPGVRRAFIALGSGALAISALLAVVETPGPVWLVRAARVLGAAAASYGIGMAAYMTYGSRVGKVRTRDRLLRALPWTGAERVLDVGCGRGLMAIGAAHYVPRGEVVGIDRWSATDQTDNTAAAAQDNAMRAGVAGRMRIDTGDARALPYADAAFDVVLSHWVVHNLPEARDRALALDEMLRVLRPGGALLVADIAHRAEYLSHLRAVGVTDLRVESGGLESAVIGVFSGNTFRPQAIVARKAET